MNNKRLSILILCIFQATTFTPFSYNASTNRFQKSRILKIYSISLNIIIQIFFYYCLSTWLQAFQKIPVINKFDIIFMMLEFIVIAIQLCHHLKFCIYDTEHLVNVLNDILNCFQLFSDLVVDNGFITRVIMLLLFEFIVTPLPMLIISYSFCAHLNLIELATCIMFLTFTLIWSLIALFPLILTLYFGSYVLEKHNRKIENLSKLNNNLGCEIKKTILIYNYLSNILSKLSYINSFNICTCYFNCDYIKFCPGSISHHRNIYI